MRHESSGHGSSSSEKGQMVRKRGGMVCEIRVRTEVGIWHFVVTFVGAASGEALLVQAFGAGRGVGLFVFGGKKVVGEIMGRAEEWREGGVVVEEEGRLGKLAMDVGVGGRAGFV